MILIILLIAIGALIGVVWGKYGLRYLNSYRLLLRSKCFRGPRAFPFIGNSLLFIGGATDFYDQMMALSRKFQSPFRLWLGSHLYFVLQEPESVKLILLSRNALEKDSIYQQLKPLFGNGLVTGPGKGGIQFKLLSMTLGCVVNRATVSLEPDSLTVQFSYIPRLLVSLWKPHRKVIEPFFSTKVVESNIPLYTRNALATVKKMMMDELNREFDVHHYMSRYTFDSTCGTTMGINLDAINNESCPLFDPIKSLQETVVTRTLRPWFRTDFIFKCTSMGQTFYKNLARAHGDIRNILNTAVSELQEETVASTKKYLIHQLLMLAKDDCKFTEQDIIDHMATLIISGYETTANLLCAAIFIMARYPNIQDNVYAEVRNIFGESGVTDVTLKDIHRLQYMDRFVKETLRFFPGVPTLFRQLSEEINIGEFTLPMGSRVFINMIATHRNDKYWPRPLEFNPDRFLPDHPLGPRQPYAFMPFSLGPRNCIGLKSGMTSTKILLATLVSRCIIKTRISQEVADLEMKMDITFRTKNPIMVSIEKRVTACS